MTQVKFDSTSVAFEGVSETPSSSGAFDSSARLDVGAALMRNQTWVANAKWAGVPRESSGGPAPERISITPRAR